MIKRRLLTAGPTALPIAAKVTAIPLSVPRSRKVGEEFVNKIVLQGNANIPAMLLTINNANIAGCCSFSGRITAKGVKR